MYVTDTGPLRRWSASIGVVGFAAFSPFRSRPHEAYRLLRGIDRVHESPIGIWVLSGHPEVAAALRHPGMGVNEESVDTSALRLGLLKRMLSGPAGGWERSADGTEAGDRVRHLLRQLMLFRDPPDHTRLRSLINKAFTARSSSSLEQRIVELIDDRIGHLESHDRIDFLAEIAYPLPALVICELLGVPAADADLIIRHAPLIAARLDPGPIASSASRAAAASAAATMTDYLGGLIAARRKKPGNDLLSAMLGAEDSDGGLNHDELVGMALLLLIAGHETTANLLGNGLLAILRAPDQWETFKASPEYDAAAVEELMRFDGPIQMTQRITLQDVEIGSTRIPKGRLVILCVAAANRDPAVFAHPTRLDLERDPNPHLGFGAGAHYCVGASLARLETRLVLRALADRFPDLALAAHRPRWRRSFTIRGLRELPVCLNAGR